MTLKQNFILIAWLVITSLTGVFAQQDSQYTQYMYNTQTINPAYAGSRGVPSILGVFRTQWVGLDGAPETFNLSGSMPVGVLQKVGIGFAATQDAIGPQDETTITGDFSYTIDFGQNTVLAFGVKAGFNNLNIDYRRLNIFDNTDNVFQNNIDNQFSPVVGAGIYLHDNEKWYVGLSVPNFLETTYYDDTTISNANERAAFYGIAGYVFNVGQNTKLKPAVLTKMVSGAPIALDVSLNALFNDKFTLGAAYRLDAAVSALAGFQVSDAIMIGYAYDYGVQELANFNSGSHEIFLRFELNGRSNTRLLSPRFF